MKKFFVFLMTFVMAFLLVGCSKTPELSFETTTYDMKVGEEVELKPTILNLEGEDLVKYEIADGTVVKVTGSKLVALKEGTTTITATLKDFAKVPAITLTVKVTKVAVLSIAIEGPNQVRKGESITLKAIVDPANATYKDVTWTVEDDKIATIDKTGKVTGVKTGKTVIKAACDGIESEFELEVVKPLVSKVTITGVNTMEINKTQKLEATIEPSDASKQIEWSSDNEKVATVTGDGTVKSLTEGTVKITAKAKDDSGVKSEFTITVTMPKITKVEIKAEKTELKVEGTLQLTAEVTPSNANQKVTWKSSAETIATVSETGLVTGIASGEVTITATASNNMEAKVILIVTDLDKHVVLVNPTYKDGAKFVEDGKEYQVGINAFKTLKEAIEEVDAGGRVILAAGTYDEQITINKPVSIIGNNANINPNTDKLNPETIFTGTIVLDGAKNVNINGISLTGKGNIQTTADKQVSNVVLSNINVYNKGEVASTWTETGRDYDNNAAINFVQNSNSQLHNKVIVKDSKFDVKDYAIKFGKCQNITVSGCTFRNFEQSAIRIEGGFNGAEFNFKDNLFEDGLKAYNAVYFNYYGNGSTSPTHTMNFDNNTFKNIGNGKGNYSAAVSSRGYQEGGAAWHFNGNTFENCYSFLLIRNNATAENHASSPWTLTAKFNKFIGEPTKYYYNCRVTSGDNEQTAPANAVFDHNIFLDKTGKTVVTPSNEKFLNYKENTNAFKSLVEYEMYKLGIEDEIKYVVNGNWKTMEAGAKVDFAGIEFTLGTNAFATIKEALDKAQENEAIYVFAGTYGETVNINKNGIKLYGPNAGINPNIENREAEAVIDGEPIIIGKDIKDVKLQGIQINGKTQVNVMAGGVDHLVMKNCLLTTSNGSGAHPVIAGYDEANTKALSKNFEFRNNRFESATNSRIVGFYSLEGLIFDGNFISSPGKEYNDLLKIDRPKGEIIVTNNIFQGCGQDGMFIGLRENAITKMEIMNNIFDGTGKLVDYGNTIDIRKSSVENAQYKIQYNTFMNMTDKENILNIKGFTAAAKVDINYNKFYGTNAATILLSDKTNITFNLEENYFEDAKYAEKVSDVAITKAVAKDSEVKKYPLAPEINIKDITISSNPGSIFQLQDFKIEFELIPANATNKKVLFSVSDENIASISSNGILTGINPGYVTVYITSATDSSVEASIEVEVKAQKRIDATLKGETVLSKGETSTIETTIIAGSSDDKVNWTTSNDKVLTVDEAGVVKAIGKGEATIKGTLSTNELITIEFTFTVIDDIKELDTLLQTLVSYNNSTVLYQNIHATGYQFEYDQYTYGSVNLYDFEPLDIDKSITVEVNEQNRPGTKKDSIQYVTIHNTDSSDKTATARAHANYVRNGGGGTSWGYSVGNDGIYYQLPDDEVSYHAGDGSRKFKLEDTGVKVTVPASEAKIGFDEKGYYTINGITTKLRPYVWDRSTGTDSLDKAIYKTEQINQMGLTLVEKNGNYFLNKTYANGKTICNYGGNRNSIGMETMVNIESNLELTQHRAAKLAASLCIKYNLPTSRIVGHHFFSGKNCPQTIMENNLWDRLKDICDAEYNIQKNFKDYKIEFKSNTPDILADNGMIIKAPAKTMTVSYTITVTKGTNTKSITLHSVVPGCLVKPLRDFTNNDF